MFTQSITDANRRLVKYNTKPNSRPALWCCVVHKVCESPLIYWRLSKAYLLEHLPKAPHSICLPLPKIDPFPQPEALWNAVMFNCTSILCRFNPTYDRTIMHGWSISYMGILGGNMEFVALAFCNTNTSSCGIWQIRYCHADRKCPLERYIYARS